VGCSDQLIVPRFSQKEITETVGRRGLLTMEIEFNSICNFDCPYCYLDVKTPKKGELSRDEFRGVLRQARELGVGLIVILGGEPMLYPHILEMVEYIRQLGMDVEMFTNGARMTDAAAAKLFENDVSVVLKCNSFVENIQDELCGKKGAFTQIHSAFAALKKAGYPSDTKPLGVSTIMCKSNFDELEELWKWIRNQGMTPYFEMITPQGNAKINADMEVDPDKISRLFYRLAEIDKTYGFDWEPQPPLVGAKCLRHQYSCVVNSVGDVTPCVGVTIPVGNVKDRPLADIIGKSKVMDELRNYKQHIKGPCRDCEDLEHCYGCRGAAYQVTGDYLASDPLCWKNKDNVGQAAPLPAGARGLVPHAPPMLIVDKLLTVMDTTSVEAHISEDMAFVRKDGIMDEVAYLEMIAQAMAAHNGYKNIGNPETVREAFLVGASKVKVYGAAMVGDTLRIDVCKVAEVNGTYAVVNGQIFKGDKMLAEGEIKVWTKSNKPVTIA